MSNKISKVLPRKIKDNSRRIFGGVIAILFVAAGIYVFFISDDSLDNVDCRIDECTDACETASQRTFTETVAQSGNGTACPEAVDCAPGDGQCPVVSSGRNNPPRPSLSQDPSLPIHPLGGPELSSGDTFTCGQWYSDNSATGVTKNDICSNYEGTTFSDTVSIPNTVPSITLDDTTLLPNIDSSIYETCCVVPDDPSSQNPGDSVDQRISSATLNVGQNMTCAVNNATIHANGISDSVNTESGINFSNLLIPDALDDSKLFNLPSADQQSSLSINDGNTAYLTDIFPRNPNAEYEYGQSKSGSQVNESYSYETDFQNLFSVTCNNGVLEGLDDWYSDLRDNTVYSDNNKYCKKGDLLYLEGNTPPQGNPKLLLNTGDKSPDRQINLFLNQNNINQTLSWEDVGLDTATGENDINNYHCSDPAYNPRYRTVSETATNADGQEITRQILVTDPKCSSDGVQLPFECKNTCVLNLTDSNLVSDTNLDGGYRLKQKPDGSGLYTIDELKAAIDQLNIVPGDDGVTKILNEYLECSDTYQLSTIGGDITASCSDQANSEKYIQLNGCNLRTCRNKISNEAATGNMIYVVGGTQMSLDEGCGTEAECNTNCIPETVQVNCDTWFQDQGIGSFCGTDKLFAQQTGGFILTNSPESTHPDPIETCCATDTMKSNEELISIFDDTTGNKFCSDNYTFNTIWQTDGTPSDLNTTFSNLAGASGSDVELSPSTQDNILQKLRNGETVNGLVSPICKLTDEKKCDFAAVTCPAGTYQMSNRYVSADETPDESKCCYPADAQFTLDPSNNMFHEFINNTIESPQLMNQYLGYNNEFKYNNSGTINGSESSGLTNIIRTYNNQVCNEQPWTLHIDDPDGDNYYRVSGCDQTCTLTQEFVEGTSSDLILGETRQRIPDGLLAAPDSTGLGGGLLYELLIDGIDPSSNNVNLASINQRISEENSLTGQTYCGVRGTADTERGGTICNQIPVDNDGVSDETTQCNTTSGCSTLYRCLESDNQGGSEYTYHKSPPSISTDNNSLLRSISNQDPIYNNIDLCDIAQVKNAFDSDGGNGAKGVFTQTGPSSGHFFCQYGYNPTRGTSGDMVNIIYEWDPDSNPCISIDGEDGVPILPKCLRGPVSSGELTSPIPESIVGTCSPISCISDSGESVFIDNYERIKTVASIGHGDLQDGSEVVYDNKDNSFHGIQLSCTAGNTTTLNGCDVLLTQDSTSNPSDPTVPPVLYHSSIFDDSLNPNTDKNCANFIDYETIDYTKTPGISEVTDLDSPDIRRSNIVTREQVETDQSLINTSGGPMPSIEDSKALCTNENNAIFYPHKENQACAPGYHPIEDHINLGGSFFHECNASQSEADCDIEYCEWVPSDANDGSGICKNIATARCKEIVEPGTSESFYNGFTHIYQTGQGSEFGEKEHTTQCQVSEGYYGKSHYDNIEVTDPNSIYKSIGDPQIIPLSNKMNCNSDPYLFDANHKLTKALPDQTSGHDNNLRFRLNINDDLDIIKRGLTKQTTESTDTNICQPGYILQLEGGDPASLSADPVQNFVCSPCPPLQNMNTDHLSLCGVDSATMDPINSFNDLNGYLTGDIQSSNIIPSSTYRYAKFCEENYIYIYNVAESTGSCEPKSCSVSNDNTIGIIDPISVIDSDNYNYGSEEIIKYNVNPDLTFTLNTSTDDSENIGYFINDQFKYSNTNLSCSGDKNALSSACLLAESCSATLDQSTQSIRCLNTDDINIPWTGNSVNILDSIPLNSQTNTVQISNPCNSWIDPTTSYTTKEICVGSTIPVHNPEGTIDEVSTGNFWVDYSNYGNDPNTGNPLESLREGFSNLHNAVEESASGRSGICLSIPKNKNDTEISEIIKLGISPGKTVNEYGENIKFMILVKLLEEIHSTYDSDQGRWDSTSVMNGYLEGIQNDIDTETSKNIKILGPPGKSCSEACSMIDSVCDSTTATSWFDDPNHPKHSCASLNDFLDKANSDPNESVQNLVRISDSTHYNSSRWGINQIASPDTDGFNPEGQWTGFKGCGRGDLQTSHSWAHGTDTPVPDEKPYYQRVENNPSWYGHYDYPTCRTKVENYDHSLSKNLLLNDQIMSQFMMGTERNGRPSYDEHTHRNSSYVTDNCSDILINDDTLPYINNKSEYYKWCCQAVPADQYLQNVSTRDDCDQACVDAKKARVQEFINEGSEFGRIPSNIMVREGDATSHPWWVGMTWCFDDSNIRSNCCVKAPDAAIDTIYSNYENRTPQDMPENWYVGRHGMQGGTNPSAENMNRYMEPPEYPPIAYSEKFFNSAGVFPMRYYVADVTSDIYDTHKCRAASVRYNNPYPPDVPDFPQCENNSKDGPWEMGGVPLPESGYFLIGKTDTERVSENHRFNYIYNMNDTDSTAYNTHGNGQIYQNEQLLSAYPNEDNLQDKSGISCRFAADTTGLHNASTDYDCDYYEKAGQRLCFCNYIVEYYIKNFTLIKRTFYMCKNETIFTDLQKFTSEDDIILSSLLDKYHREKSSNPSGNMIDYFIRLSDTDYNPYTKSQVISMIDKLISALLMIISDTLTDVSTEYADGWGEYGNFSTPIEATIKDIDNNDQTVNLYGNVPYQESGNTKTVTDDWLNNVNTCGWIMDLSTINADADTKKNIVNKYSRVCNRLMYEGDETARNQELHPPTVKFEEISEQDVSINSIDDFISLTLNRDDIPPYYYKLKEEGDTNITLFNNNNKVKESDSRSLCTTKKSSNNDDYLVCSYNLMIDDNINNLDNAKESLIQPYLGYIKYNSDGGTPTAPGGLAEARPYVSGGDHLRHDTVSELNYNLNERTDIWPDDISINRYSYLEESGDSSSIVDYEPLTVEGTRDRPAKTVTMTGGASSKTFDQLRDYNKSTHEAINDFNIPTNNINCGWKNHVWVHTEASPSYIHQSDVKKHIAQNYNYCLGQFGRAAGFSGEGVVDSYGLQLGKHDGSGGDTRIIPDTCFPRTVEEQQKLDQSIVPDSAHLFTKHHQVAGTQAGSANTLPDDPIYFGLPDGDTKNEITDIRKNILLNSKGFCAPCPHNTIQYGDDCYGLPRNTYGWNPQFNLEEVYDVGTNNLAKTKHVFNHPEYDRLFSGGHGTTAANKLLLGDAIYNSDGRQKPDVDGTTKEGFYYQYLEDQECGEPDSQGFFNSNPDDVALHCFPQNVGEQSVVNHHYYVQNCDVGWLDSQPSPYRGTYDLDTSSTNQGRVAFYNNWVPSETGLTGSYQNVRTKTCGSGDGWGYTTPTLSTDPSMRGKCPAGQIRDTSNPATCVDVSDQQYRDQTMEDVGTASNDCTGASGGCSAQEFRRGANGTFAWKCADMVSVDDPDLQCAWTHGALASGDVGCAGEEGIGRDVCHNKTDLAQTYGWGYQTTNTGQEFDFGNQAHTASPGTCTDIRCQVG